MQSVRVYCDYFEQENINLNFTECAKNIFVQICVLVFSMFNFYDVFRMIGIIRIRHIRRYIIIFNFLLRPQTSAKLNKKNRTVEI